MRTIRHPRRVRRLGLLRDSPSPGASMTAQHPDVSMERGCTSGVRQPHRYGRGRAMISAHIWWSGTGWQVTVTDGEDCITACERFATHAEAVAWADCETHRALEPA